MGQEPTGKSQWIYPDASGKLVYKTTKKGDRIIDFSHAGYKGGGVTLPYVPAKLTVHPLGENEDCTDYIQKAIDMVSALPYCWHPDVLCANVLSRLWLTV